MNTNDHPNIFEDDVVILNNNTDPNQKKYGTVYRVQWNKDDDEDDDEDSNSEEMGPDTVEVLWPNTTSFHHSSTLKVIDRSLLHGDIVALASDPQGQTGTVVDVVLFADVEFVNSKQKLYAVPTPYVSNIHDFPLGTVVTNDQKLVGVVVDCIEDVHVRFPDGAKCIMKDASSDILWPKNEDDESENFNHFPSQKVESTPTSWKRAEWISGQWNSKKNRKFATVTKVIPKSVFAEWIIQPADGTPPLECKVSDLKLMNYFGYSKYQVGDQVHIHPKIKDFYSLNEADNIDFSMYKLPNHQDIENTLKLWKEKGEDNLAIIRCTHTFIKVLWQNGELSEIINSVDVIPRDFLLDSDLWPGDFVIDKEQLSAMEERLGVIMKVNSTEQTAIVRWIPDFPYGTKLTEPEEVAVYTIVEHPTYKYRLGTVVVSLNKEDVGEVLDIVTNGTTDLNGLVKIYWAHSQTTTIESPNDLFVLDDDDLIISDDSDSDFSEDEDEYAEEGEEGEGEEEVEEGDVEAEELEEGNEGDIKNEEDKEDKEVEVNNADEAKKNKDVINQKEENENDPQKKTLTFNIENSGEIVENTIPSVKAENTSEDAKNTEEIFKHETPSFQILDELQKHYYLNTSEPPGLKLVRTIMKEHKILSAGLPPNVFLCTFSSRLDLMKLLIIGPSNTIYYSSYFIFDICLPPDYPQSPPTVYYHSQGCKLHPNLYDNGNVCLSLLGTWIGNSQEQWNPNHSNILQLVVSLQGLILGVKEPYFLEAGYEKQKGTTQGNQNSRQYNERSLLLSLRVMLQNYLSPPSEFKSLISDHFKFFYPCVIKLGEYGKLLLESSDPESTLKDKKELQDIAKKFYLVDTPTKGFLISLVKNTIPKFKVVCDQLEPETQQEKKNM